MRCSHCEKCCHETEMPLCEADIVRLERIGYERSFFTRRGADGITRLLNIEDYCFFYDRERRRCKEYSRRPLGCVLYPVNISVDGEVVVDDLCPEASSVGREELNRKGRRLRMLLDTLAVEAKIGGVPPIG